VEILKRTAALVVAATIAGCAPATGPEDHAAANDIEAIVATAGAEELPTYFEAGGVVRARLTAAVASRVLAPVVDVTVVPGDRVGRGQVLIRLDSRELDANQARATAALAAAEQAVEAVGAQEQMAIAGLTLASATYDRISALHAKRSATPQELDRAEAGRRTAEAQAAAASAQSQQARSALEAARAEADAARVAASYAALSAPFDGMVATRTIDPGSIAVPGVPLISIEDTSALTLEVRLDEARIADVSVGGDADVQLDHDAGGAPAWTAGRVVEVARVDPTTHSFIAKVALPAGTAARTGSFGRARFAGRTRSTLTVPASAVVERGQLTFVFALDDSAHARLRPVNRGASAGDRVEVLAGLREGDRVVAAPTPALTDGARIRDASQGGSR
jgi:multidrug efflux pump subunit AcrA (membrane-fusion protein)